MNAVTQGAIAVLFGTGLGAGLILMVWALPRWRAQTLVARIGPYVRDVTGAPAPTNAASGFSAAVARAFGRAGDRVGEALGSTASVAARLEQAGSRFSATQFRGLQLGVALGAGLLGAALGIALAVSGGSAPGAVLLAPVAAALGAVGCDVVLRRRALARVRRVREELPEVLDFLRMCISAGEGLLASLRRVGDLGSGDLTAQLRGVALAVGTGRPLTDELLMLSQTLRVPALTRAIDQLVASIERGAPLAAVLQAQASDAREEARRALIERAGKAEVVMLLPLVFLILPLSVLFAIYPGIYLLQHGIG